MRKTPYYKKPKSRGQILSKARLEKKMSLKVLSHLVGCTEGYLSRIENDIQSPSAKILFSLFKNIDGDFDVMMDWILEDFEYYLSKIGINVSLLFSKNKLDKG
jgi:transcriptional regulator with XRE-family HTH domain